MSEYVTVWEDHEPTKLHWGVPVVRCRDCKYSSISFEETRTTCRFWALNDYDESNSSHGYTLYPCVKPDGFCAWGERRDDE